MNDPGRMTDHRRILIVSDAWKPQVNGVVRTLNALIAELSPCDWVLVEGFKHGDLPKVEVWRAAPDGPGRAPLYPQDPQVVAVATDAPDQLPELPAVPVLDLNDPAALVQHLLASGERYLYHPPHHG